MPSGMLCSVTASTIIVVRFQWAGRPSASSLSRCRWGSRWSRASRNTPPRRKPPPTGSRTLCPRSSTISMAGISRDHTDAAIITPAANPRNTFCMVWDIPFLKKNTMAAPSTVARQVKPVPRAAYSSSRCNINTPPFNFRSLCMGIIPHFCRKHISQDVKRDGCLQPSLFMSYQNSALPTVRGWGSTSRMLETPVRYMTRRSKPRPKPACLQLP